MDFNLSQQMYAVVQQQQFQQVYNHQHGVAYAPEVVQEQYNLRMPYANYYYEALPTYSAEPYLPGPPLAEHEMMQPAPVVHAPVPISVGPQFSDGSCFAPDGSEPVGEVVNRPGYYASVDYPAAPIRGNFTNAPQGQGSWLGHRELSVPLTTTFPTPSELLVELAANDDSSTLRGPTVSTADSPGYSASPEPSENALSEQDTETPRSAHPMSRSSSVSILPETATVNDTISSHEKKRYYLECLEQYVMYLHDQFNLLGANPVPLRRVETYRGLDSRSIRTLLVHMEGNNKKLEDKTVAEERRFLALRDEVLRKDMGNSKPVMSFSDVTRNCFQSGISATRWLHLCKTFTAQNPIIASEEEIAKQISNSVLVLYQSYPADPGLNSYLKAAIEDSILPLPVYVSTFLDAFTVTRTQLNAQATLDFLCDLAVTIHEESGHLPLGSLVSSSEDSLHILLNVQRCLGLIDWAYSIPLTRRSQKLRQNSGKLLVHLLSCVNDMSQVTIANAWEQMNVVNSVLQKPELERVVREHLDSLSMNLAMILQDEPKAAREAQMLQSMQMAKGDVGGPNSENDVITLGLLWQYLVTHRAHEFGAGSTKQAVALILSHWRSSSWPPQVFYAQVFISAFTCLASNIGNPLIWKAFVVGRLPVLLASFHASVSADQTVDWRESLRYGLRLAFRRPDLIVSGDHILSQAISNGASDGVTSSYAHELLQQLVKVELIDLAFALELDPSLANHPGSNSIQLDASTDADSTASIEARLSQEMESAENGWFHRMAKDAAVHSIFANLVLKRFATFSKALDVEPLSEMCKLLFTQPLAMDLVALHVTVSDLIFYALLFLAEYDCETVGDPQTGVGHLGNVVLFVQYALGRFQLDIDIYVKDNRKLPAEFLRQTHEVLAVDSFTGAEATSFHSWFKALFDSSSEGIEDSILRSTHPKVLLRISATLFCQAIKAVSAQKIDSETLLNGVSYFTGPLLNWTLVGVIKALVREAQSARLPTPPTLEIVQTLLLSPSCPEPVRALCRTSVLRYLADKHKGIPGCPSFKLAAVREIVRAANGSTAAQGQKNASGLNTTGANTASNDPKNGSSNNSANGADKATSAAGASSNGNTSSNTKPAADPQTTIREAFDMSRTNKIVEFDVDRCLKICNSTRFLQMLWEQCTKAIANCNPLTGVGVSMAATVETARRITTYVLTMPPNFPPAPNADGGGGGGRVPPLLPVFMHLVVPWIVAAIETVPEQLSSLQTQKSTLIEVLTSIVLSSLTAALHLEWSLSTVLTTTTNHQNSNSNSSSSSSSENQNQNRTVPVPVLGASSLAVAKRLAHDLRARKGESGVCNIILQRLASSQSFVANFPYFSGELST